MHNKTVTQLSDYTDMDYKNMQIALDLANQAAAIGEVPVGAVIFDRDNQIIAKAYNRTIVDSDPSAHAEILAMRQAGAKLSNYRLNGLRLYVTLEPCLMCLGAIFHARIAELIYAAKDPKTGACGGFKDLASLSGLNHHTSIKGGIMANQSAELLRNFFKARR